MAVSLVPGSSTPKLTLENLYNNVPGMAGAWGTFLAEAAVLAFDMNLHQSGTTLKVKGGFDCEFQVYWAIQVTEQMIAT
ncbi:MAG: hypothetical protein M3014_11590 [Chloroflexota bacterium]|nr:hypothetical protein [Chloroflexota bacterium]